MNNLDGNDEEELFYETAYRWVALGENGQWFYIASHPDAWDISDEHLINATYSLRDRGVAGWVGEARFVRSKMTALTPKIVVGTPSIRIYEAVDKARLAP